MDWERLSEMPAPYVPCRDDPDYPLYSNFEKFLSDDYEPEDWDSVLERNFKIKKEVDDHHADDFLNDMKDFDMARIDLLHEMNVKKAADIQ
jgi:hypothetical protein